MVQLVRHDLEFILKQIKIAEAHTAGTPLTDLVGHDLLPYGLRTVNGSYNNLTPGHEWSGSADQVMPRLLDPVYVPGETMPAGLHRPGAPAGTTGTHYQNSGDVYDSDPRLISNLLSDQTIGNPATIISALTNMGHEDPYAVLNVPTNLSTYNAAVTAYKACEVAEKTLAQATANVTAAEMALGRNPADPAAAQAALDAAKAAKVSAQSVVTTASEAKKAAYDAMQDALGVAMEGDTVVIPNVSADLGDTAPFNGFFTLFGQFFDHGLDLVSKGDNGTVYIPLSSDDPLYVAGSSTNFMVLTRATVARDPGADGQLNTADDIVGQRNETTPWIDLNQVYTSNPSHQVFLREYALVDGKPVATGRMLEGKNGGPATWADVKEQAATKLGIILTDIDVLRVPAVLTDMYGEFVRGTNGFPQLVMINGGPTETSVGQPLAASLANSAGRAFLNDIAHNAAPGTVYDADGNPVTQTTAVVQPDADTDAGNSIEMDYRGRKVSYDNELLDRHVIVGDGRGNENIGLTSIHHVFHSEHNRMIEETKAIALESGDLAFLNEWLTVKLPAGSPFPASGEGLQWDGERLFQAARFSTEMVYQHLVFEEFARAAAPDVDPFVFSNTTTIDGAIVAEFAHVVYRFGHSMLTDSIDMISMGANGPVAKEIGLIEAFLNPIAFGNAGTNPDDAAGVILRGMTRQVGNEIDEYLTDALRNNLVGLPLDLGAVNIARARETGVPSLNEARRQFYEDTQDSRVKPYESWYDFALSLKTPASLINFIAAYGTHQSIVSAQTAEAKRAAATLLVLGGNDAPTDRLDFLNATGSYTGGSLGGLNNVDFWIGGLAEKKMTFGSMLGSTFTYVFEYQMEALQAGDRFYYLSRTQGLNLLNELEADSFAQLIMRNTSLGEHNSTHVNGSAFQTADYILEMDRTKQIGADPRHSNPVLDSISPMVVRKDVDGDGDADYLRYTGTDHVVLGGTNEDDTLIGGEGDDTLWGDDGNDRLEGGYGVDHLHGGKGHDIITDSGTDVGAADVIHGDDGDDVINPGSGLDLVFGGRGSDFIYGGTEGKTVSGGLDNDFIRGSTGGSMLAGNEGDDWIEGGDSFDTLAGENSELFFNSTIIGHDVLNGRGNDNDYDAESGDDIMIQGQGIERNNGMAGFDWAIHKGNNQAADSDMTISIFQNQQNNILRDRFDLVEGLSGWNHNDKLTGRDIVQGAYDADGNATQVDPGAPLDSYSNALLEKNVALINGLDKLVAHLERTTVTVAGKTETIVMDTADASDIILGGGGSDTITGGGGNDIIDGDKWLNVRIEVSADASRGQTFETFSVDSLDQIQARMFSGEIRGSQLKIVRELLDSEKAGDKDVAVYWDVRANYSISQNADGSITVEHVTVSDAVNPVDGGNRVSDGTDRLFNIEKLKFADQEVSITPPKLSLHAFDAGNYRDDFNPANYVGSDGTAAWTSSWVETADGTNSGANGQIVLSNQALRFQEGDGATITRAVNLDGLAIARLSFNADPANLENDDYVSIQFSPDGNPNNFVELGRITGDGANTLRTFDLTGPFTANAAIRFVATSFENGGFFGSSNDVVTIDNVAVDFFRPAIAPSVNYATSFTEGSTGVAIANHSSIVDDTSQMVSARIVLTNAQASDVLTVGTLPAGIAAVVTSAAGQITVDLTGVASLAAYQSAIQAVTFSNGSQNPVAGSRVIQVTVNDGLLVSNVATTTVNVIAVNDAPVANNDTVFTNFTTAPFIVPEWALLANDTDGEGAALDVTALSAVNGLTASLTANPGSVTLTDTGTAGGAFTYTANDGSGAANATDTANVTVTRDTTGAINGNDGDNILIGDGANSTLSGGQGNDLVFAGAGNDTITWGVTTFFGFEIANDGRDFVDGGAGTLDRFVVTGSNAAETFVVYAKAEAIAAGIAGLKADTEIVITRNGNVIAELDNIEEITINTGAGNDTVQAVGNFNPTSLNFSTITINGNEGDDTVDISSLQSAHRIVFRSNGGTDTIVGTLREQDVIELPLGMALTDFTRTDNEDGTTTLVSPTHKITYVGSRNPIVRECTPDDVELPVEIVAADDSFTVKKGEVLNLTAAALLANDVDMDGDELCIVSVDEGEHGEVMLNADGTITFTPKPGFTGTASFTYLVKDGRGNYDQGNVTITVQNTPSAPVP
ncbi:peroxidase family protein, partial [Microvirga aerophila]